MVRRSGGHATGWKAPVCASALVDYDRAARVIAEIDATASAPGKEPA
jgi:hypothetical protein